MSEILLPHNMIARRRRRELKKDITRARKLVNKRKRYQRLYHEAAANDNYAVAESLRKQEVAVRMEAEQLLSKIERITKI